MNLFAHRDTSPRALQTAAEPIGPANDHVLEVLTRAGARTIAAWGSGGNLYDRSSQVARLLDHPLCLGTTRLGQPRHPFYVSRETTLVPWTAPLTPERVPGERRKGSSNIRSCRVASGWASA